MTQVACYAQILSAGILLTLCSCERKDAGPADTNEGGSGKSEKPKQAVGRDEQDAVTSITWDQALSLARQKSSEEEIRTLVAWVLATGDFSKLQTLLGENGETLDERSNKIFASLARTIEASFFKRNLPGRGRSPLQDFEEFASTDPSAAAKLAFAMAASGGQSIHVLLSRAGWYAGKTDRENALALALREAGRNPEAALAFAGGVLSEWSRTDYLSACEWVEQISSSYPELPELAEIVVSTRAAKSPSDAYAWTQRLPAAYANAAKISIAAAWAENEPSSALEWGLSVDGDLRDQVLESAVAAGAQSRPSEVAEWLTVEGRLPDDVRDDLLLACAEVWAHRDAKAVSQWIVDTQGRADVVPAAQGLIRVLKHQDVFAAVEMALQISHDPRGMVTLHSVLRDWRKFHYKEFKQGTEELVQRLREEGETSLSVTLQSAAARTGEERSSTDPMVGEVR